MGNGNGTLRAVRACILAATTVAPAVALADEASLDPVAEAGDYYSGLEDLSLRRTIADLSHGYALEIGDTNASQIDGIPYADYEGGSAGGYINIGSSATSTFLASTLAEREERFLENVEFGVDWRPDVSGEANRDHRRLSRDLAGSEIDRVGLRADVTALLRDEAEGDAEATAWRISGMLGSASLSLMQGTEDTAAEFDDTGRGLLWDVGVGWSSGAMSLNAGYQSAFSLNDGGEELSSVAVLSLGADYAVLPGLSVYGEFNVIDRPLESNEDGLGAVVIVGTGVSF